MSGHGEFVGVRARRLCGAVLVGMVSLAANVRAGVPGTPVQLLIDAAGAPRVGEPLTLNLTVVSQAKVAGWFEIRLNAPPGADLGAEAENLSGSIPSGGRQTLAVTATPQNLGDFRVSARLKFWPTDAVSPFVVENSAVLRLRATPGFSDVFVEQKDWPRKYLADMIKAAKESLRDVSQQERDRRIQLIQGLPSGRRAEDRVPEAVLEREQAYLAAASAAGSELDRAARKRELVGAEWAGHLGSAERYAGVDGQIRRQVPAGVIYRVEFALQAGEHYTFQTRNLTRGADTVAYLFGYDEATGQLTPIARNDDADATTLGSHIEYTPQGAGNYLFVVRSYNEETRGAADVYLNDQFVERAEFAGVAFQITADAGAALQTVALERVPNRTDTLMFVWSKAGVALWDDDGGMELGSKLVLPALRGAEVVVGADSRASEGRCTLILDTTDGTRGAHPRGDLDGDGLSNELERALGTDPAVDDTDHDGFLDSWEALGIRDTDFPAFGADGTVRDVYVEVDWMASTHNHQPRPESIQLNVDSFAATGMNLHVDDGNPKEGGQGQLLPEPWTHLQFLTLGPVFQQIKLANFDFAKRGGLYRYDIFAHQQGPGNCSSGIAQIRGFDFLVTLGCFLGQIGSVSDQAGTFMHELGHNLGLRHGGFENLNYKPNYRSVMSYLFQLAGTCGTVRFNNGVQFLPCVPREFYYSFGDGVVLDENCLDENLGVGEDPLDWNGDGQFEKCVRADINRARNGPRDGRFDELFDYNDYSDLFIPVAGFSWEDKPIPEEIVTCAPPPEPSR